MVLINQSFHIDSPHHHLLSIYCLYSHLRPALLASVHIISFLAPVSSDFPAIYIYHIPPIRVTLLLCFFHTFGRDAVNLAQDFSPGLVTWVNDSAGEGVKEKRDRVVGGPIRAQRAHRPCSSVSL